MTTRTGRFSLKPIAALLLGAACVAALPPALIADLVPYFDAPNIFGFSEAVFDST